MRNRNICLFVLFVTIISFLPSCTSNQLQIKSDDEIESEISKHESIVARLSESESQAINGQQDPYIEEETTNEYSRESINYFLSQKNYGYKAYDYIFISLEYVYNNEEIKNKYGPDFTVSDMLFEDNNKRVLFPRFYSSQADCLIKISDDWYYVKLQKEFTKKWQIILFEIKT